MRNLLFEHLMA